MSWQLGAFLVLGLGLAGGFAWYERARPDARIVALVATLAAFAALGRIAFAALPNVKPTTDIVLVSGYALGGAPGFVVGALAGLTSNFFFGQGPWTPWQMAAWGATGLLGAGLATVTRGRIGRWRLALVCCTIGFVFTVVQDVGDWVSYSDHSAAQLATYVGTGLGFDAIDAAGCLVFALAFGPALLRSVQRFARRLQVSWGPPAGTVVLLVVALGGLMAVGPMVPTVRAAGRGGSARASAAPSDAEPLAYLLGAQNRDGGFGASNGQPSSALYSGWAALALAADGRNLTGVARGGRSLLAYIEATVGTDPGSIERTILVAVAAGVPPTDFGGHNLLAALNHDLEPNGSVAGQVNLTTFAVLALRAAGDGLPARTLRWLVGQQDADGGFSFATRGDLADVDDTGAALEALLGTAPSVRRRAVAFIRAAQNSDGGFPSEPGGTSNAQSTAWAVQGLIAAGVDPAQVRTQGSPSPLAYLRGLIAPDGAVDYASGVSQTPVWVTAEAIVALDGKPFPLTSVVRPVILAPVAPRVARPLNTRKAGGKPGARTHNSPARRRSRVHHHPARPQLRAHPHHRYQRTPRHGTTHLLQPQRTASRTGSSHLGLLVSVAGAALCLLLVLGRRHVRRHQLKR